MRTPLAPSQPLTRIAGVDVRMKLECLQGTGSFKLRGATNTILALTDQERARGVLAVSSGNHGRAVAAVAADLGLRAVICLAEGVPRNKVEAIRRYGAEVVIAGSNYVEASVRAHQISREQGLSFVHPYDEPPVIAGQGTIGLEILEDQPATDTLIVPISGGGLIAGVAVHRTSVNTGPPARAAVGGPRPNRPPP